MEKLIELGVIKNTRTGYVNSSGEHVGFYRTHGVAKKRYIEDYYAEFVSNKK